MSRALGASDLILALTLGQAPTLGGGRLICVDGPAGSGKTRLGTDLITQAAGLKTALVHVDDVLDGWDGLDDVAATLFGHLVTPLGQGRAADVPRYDWAAGAFAGSVHVPPVDLLVIEGCGSGSPLLGEAVTTLVWVEAPADLRLQRGIARDGEDVRGRWLTWMGQEAVLFAREGTRDRAHVVVDGTGQADPVLRVAEPSRQ